MPWWTRNRAVRYPASIVRPEGVVASAQHFDLEVEADRVRLAKLQQQWQADAATYVDTIGELKDSQRFVENCFRRVRLNAGYIRDTDEVPTYVLDAVEPDVRQQEPIGDTDDDHPGEYLDVKWATVADEIVRSFASRDGGQSALMSRLGSGIFIIGEAVVIQRAVPERRPGPDETIADVAMVWDWEVRSPDEIRQSRSNSKALMTVDRPDQQDGPIIEGVDGAPPYVERIYRKHWKWSAWADSNVRAAIDTLEELRLLGLVARASLRSRAMAGVWTVPDEMDFGAADQPGDAGGGRKPVRFDQTFADAISSSITNEAEAASVAPTIVRGPAEFLHRDVFGPIAMPSRYASDERDQREDAVTRLGRTIELPQERLTGVTDVNHWSAWQIDEDTYRAYIEPLVQVVDEGLTFGYLRPLLEREGCPPELIDRFVVYGDASQLVRRHDRGKVADEGVSNEALSWPAWRRANGFSDDDAPTLSEMALRIAIRTREAPALGAILLEQAGIIPPGTADKIIAADTKVGQPGVVPQPPGTPEPPALMPGPPSTSDPEAVAAAATVARLTSPRLGTRLTAIDSSLRARLGVLCDQAVLRALERAGARLRTRSKDPAVRVAVAAAVDVPNGQLGQRLGPALVASVLGPDPITADDFADLADRFERWTAAAQTLALAELAEAAGDRLSDADLMRLRTAQADDRRSAWEALLAGLVGFAAYRLTMAEDDEEQTGEWEPTAVVRPSLLRMVLAIAGGTAVVGTSRGGVERADGGAPGGPATGDTITGAFASVDVPVNGYVWVYGSEPRATPFEEHLRLDGVEFTDWDDDALQGYAPGDHANCRCDFEPLYDESFDDKQAAHDGDAA